MISPRSAPTTSANPGKTVPRTRSTRRRGQAIPREHQRGKDGKAKAYQVRQVLDAIARLEAEKNEENDDA
jgi:hypothetical protein